MQVLSLFTTILLLGLSAADEPNSSSKPGPVTNVMENLAYNTAAITDEIALQLQTKIDRTSEALLGDIEVIIATTLDQLAAPIFQANREISAKNCQPTWSMDELQNRINNDISACTENMYDIIEIFKNDAATITSTLQTSVNDIVNLPVLCKLLGSHGESPSFASSSSCFLNKIADINQHVAEQLNRASMAIGRTLQSAKTSGKSAEDCANGVVVEVQSFLNATLADC